MMQPRKRARDDAAPARVQLKGVTSPLVESLSAQRKEGKLVDMQLRTADGEVFQAHRCVLSTCSDFMKALFEAGMRDSESEVTLENVQGSTIAAFFDFFYEGQCEVEESELPALLETAAHLQSLPLQAQAMEALVDRMDVKNMLQVWALGDLLTLPALVAAAIRFAATNFDAFSASDAILEASYAQLTTILQHDNLNAIELFDALERWEAAVRPSELMAPLFRLAKEHFYDGGYVQVYVVTSSDLRGQSCTLDLVPSVVPCLNGNWPLRVEYKRFPCMRLKKNRTLRQLKQMIWRSTGVRPAAQRLWAWARRMNHTFRPDVPLELTYGDDAVLVGLSNTHYIPVSCFDGDDVMRLFLYLEADVPVPTELPSALTDAPDETGYPQLGESQMLLFLKFYDPTGDAIRFVGTHVADQTHTLSDLLPVLRKAAGLHAGQQLSVYEEVEFQLGLRLDKDHLADGGTLLDAELKSGDILVFQTAPLANERTIPQFLESERERFL